MKKIISIMLTLLFLASSLAVSVNAVSLSRLVYDWFATDEYIYLKDSTPYSYLDEVLEIELGNLYICGEDGKELSADDIISTGMRLMQTQENGDKHLYTFIILGDANMDGRVTAADARDILRASANLTEQPDFLKMMACDIDYSYTITAADARHILRYSAKLDEYTNFSGSKFKNLGSADQKYISFSLREDAPNDIMNQYIAEDVGEIISIPNGSDTQSTFIKLKNPGRDNVDKLLYELSKSKFIIANNPFKNDFIIIG